MKHSKLAIRSFAFTVMSVLAMILVINGCVWEYQCSFVISSLSMMMPVALGVSVALLIAAFRGEGKKLFAILALIVDVLLLVNYFKILNYELGNIFLLFWFGVFPILGGFLFTLELRALKRKRAAWKKVLLWIVTVLTGAYVLLWVLFPTLIFYAFFP